MLNHLFLSFLFVLILIKLSYNNVDNYFKAIYKSKGIKSISLLHDIKYNIIKRKVKGDKCFKWTFPINYYIGSNVHAKTVIQALQELEKQTCIRFKLHTGTTIPQTGIRFDDGEECSSLVGKWSLNNWQTITVSGHCTTIGSIQHEVLHALGIDHEHNRIDRDNYLNIYFNNIDKEDLEDFDLVKCIDSETYGIPYDYGSIMHYDRYAYSANDKITMSPKHHLYAKTIGHEQKLSFLDIQTLNIHYCSNTCLVKIQCYNGGYQDPNRCYACKCVEGYIGQLCKILSKSILLCGINRLDAKYYQKIFQQNGKKNCIYNIFAPINTLIHIRIIKLELFPAREEVCLPTTSLEIKYWKDKRITGARFCGLTRNIQILSQNNHVILHFRSLLQSNYFTIIYKIVKKRRRSWVF
ncbi:Astacin-like metalloendopeptidase [Strongyloides ratti]|uniref:Zinc metalloproteinase n=1 Tax=Strongyloides ratti TaxID=34506 RepID=A0A090LQT1_STRRB|nr:Astacin-like metalloendopeptidase [Strongyloides ratti]CEF69946.2 Astacin-like metalloendopeptidase [Strongyloides ratti]